jgi:hypothetical protein
MISEILTSVPLEELLNAILPKEGAEQNRAIAKNLALILDNALKDRLDYKVQFTSFDEEELTHPLLWLYKDWYNCSSHYYANKERSEQERVERWIKNANINNLTRALIKSQGLDESFARKTAIEILKKGTSLEVLKLFGLNRIITKENEL